MPDETQQNSRLNSPAEAALFGYYWWWLQFDGPMSKAIERQGLDGEIALEIANSYSVARTIGGKDPDRWSYVASCLDALSRTWPADMKSRAVRCIDTAHEIQRECGGNAPYSAVSKLIWFLRPDDWTIYDSYAANALITGGGDGARRFMRFYEALGDNLATSSTRISEAVASVEATLRPERVIDQYLVLRGMTAAQRQKSIERHNDRLACMHPDLRATILAATVQVAEVLNNALPRQGSRQNSRKEER